VVTLVLDSCGGSDSAGSAQGANEAADDERSTEDRGGTYGSQTMGSFDEEEPFDLPFIDQMNRWVPRG